ncbi:DUF2867 domain-containing protein [Roseibium sediminis]|uniref:DUF2867 domain-containing protein n=1 Tax=Roseibium sediminis TaxID=1775174 RepID=UPI00123C9391|nr:DUF2867 domain-containing protein [Roseibium sediminis]
MAVTASLPSHSLLNTYRWNSDYLDVFAVSLSGRSDLQTADIRELATLVLTADLPWVRRMMNLRDAIARPFGLKTGIDLAARSAQTHWSQLGVGDRIGFFRIYDVDAGEIILGEDDWHQDFRVSILRENASGEPRVLAATCCRRHNIAGHLYLALILPFHKRIVSAFLNQAVAETT